MRKFILLSCADIILYFSLFLSLIASILNTFTGILNRKAADLMEKAGVELSEDTKRKLNR